MSQQHRLRQLEGLRPQDIRGAGRRCTQCGGLTVTQVALATAVHRDQAPKGHMAVTEAERVLHEAATCAETCETCGGLTMYGVIVANAPADPE